MILDGLELPDSLWWQDEFTWAEIAQTQDRGVTGSFLVQEQRLQFGRPITLVGGREACWLPRSTLEQLYAKTNELNKTMAVTLPDGQQFTVIFNRNGQSPVQAEQLTRWQGTPDQDTWYVLETLRLITVEP
ncbi:MAG: hypothetical protein AAGI24_04030 [Pseudomonadota bacterium]